MAVSAIDPIGRAWDRMVAICFRPFDFKKWLALGFCAFLAALGQGGGSGFNSFRNGFQRGRGQGDLHRQASQVWHFVQAHLTLVLLIGAGVLLLGVALGALLQWLSSRGQFMFLDGVLKDRGAVKEPWAHYADRGNRLFLFRFCLGMVGFFLLVLLLGAAAWAVWPSIQAEEFGPRFALTLLVPGCFFALVAIALALVELILRDFGVPIMYKLDVGPWRALQIFYRELLPGHVGAFVVFYLMSILMGIGAGVVMVVGMCLTCCVAGLPYISSVAFLPVFVFFRAYGLCLLEEFGPGWDLWPKKPAPVSQPAAAAPPDPGPPEASRESERPEPFDPA